MKKNYMSLFFILVLSLSGGPIRADETKTLDCLELAYLQGLVAVVLDAKTLGPPDIRIKELKNDNGVLLMPKEAELFNKHLKPVGNLISFIAELTRLAGKPSLLGTYVMGFSGVVNTWNAQRVKKVLFVTENKTKADQEKAFEWRLVERQNQLFEQKKIKKRIYLISPEVYTTVYNSVQAMLIPNQPHSLCHTADEKSYQGFQQFLNDPKNQILARGLQGFSVPTDNPILNPSQGLRKIITQKNTEMVKKAALFLAGLKVHFPKVDSKMPTKEPFFDLLVEQAVDHLTKAP